MGRRKENACPWAHMCPLLVPPAPAMYLGPSCMPQAGGSRGICFDLGDLLIALAILILCFGASGRTRQGGSQR